MNRIKNLVQTLFVVAMLAMTAAVASAQPSSEDASVLNLSGTIESELRLDISDTSINFATVDGLYENAAGAGFAGQADGTSGAIYFKSAAITLTPHWSGFGEAPTVDIKLLGGGANADFIRESGTGTAAALKTATVNSTTATTIGASGITNGAGVNRYVGFYVPRTSTAGAIAASLTYSLEVTPQ